MSAVGDRVGVRESRRILGLRTLTQDDVLNARRDETAIGMGAFPIDVHDADAPGLSHTDGLPAAYDIPFGALVAHDLTNLLAGGRCISTTHEANGSARITATCFTTGEAAGTAAALAAVGGFDAHATDVGKLQATCARAASSAPARETAATAARRDSVVPA
ncbi:FAD-dependent oxidoreductase, partial [Dactylosporangium salmoneum]|uniref:FAD-dependent oxidoreductase n=1 Tax=Dactylosporangium salmoneum TaxID=53361 RepID=UPI0031D2FFAA